jgi:Tfp pilus assembly protein PilF
MGNLTEAKIDIEKSLELDGKNSYAYKNLALYYIEMKNTTKALTSLNKAKDLGFKELYGNEVDELLHQINDGT